MQNFRIKLKSYDHTLVDRTAKQIVEALSTSRNVIVRGPIPLPTRRRLFTVLRSPHVNAKSREQFELCFHKRFIDVFNATTETVDTIGKLELPPGVNIEIKMIKR
jgi:small subunit ribosomal protein S10